MANIMKIVWSNFYFDQYFTSSNSALLYTPCYVSLPLNLNLLREIHRTMVREFCKVFHRKYFNLLSFLGGNIKQISTNAPKKI